MTRKEANKIKDMIDSLKSYPYATQYDKGDYILDRKDIEFLEIFISAVSSLQGTASSTPRVPVYFSG